MLSYFGLALRNAASLLPGVASCGSVARVRLLVRRSDRRGVATADMQEAYPLGVPVPLGNQVLYKSLVPDVGLEPLVPSPIRKLFATGDNPHLRCERPYQPWLLSGCGLGTLA